MTHISKSWIFDSYITVILPQDQAYKR